MYLLKNNKYTIRTISKSHQSKRYKNFKIPDNHKKQQEQPKSNIATHQNTCCATASGARSEDAVSTGATDDSWAVATPNRLDGLAPCLRQGPL